jgi:hypothetical protein
VGSLPPHQQRGLSASTFFKVMIIPRIVVTTNPKAMTTTTARPSRPSLPIVTCRRECLGLQRLARPEGPLLAPLAHRPHVPIGKINRVWLLFGNDKSPEKSGDFAQCR